MTDHNKNQNSSDAKGKKCGNSKCDNKCGKKENRRDRSHRHAAQRGRDRKANPGKILLSIAAVLTALAVSLVAGWLINERIEEKTQEVRQELVNVKAKLEVMRSQRDGFCESGPLRTVSCGNRVDACVCGDPAKLNLPGL